MLGLGRIASTYDLRTHKDFMKELVSYKIIAAFQGMQLKVEVITLLWMLGLDSPVIGLPTSKTVKYIMETL